MRRQKLNYIKTEKQYEKKDENNTSRIILNNKCECHNGEGRGEEESRWNRMVKEERLETGTVYRGQ